MNWVGVFGGTFDPLHVGHMILAAEAMHELHLDRLLWVLTPAPPHKTNQPITPLKHRHAMLEAAFGDNAAFTLSSVEIDRPGPHYALDTINLLRAEYPGFALAYLIGGDSLHDLPTWHRSQEFVQACDALGVMRRLGDLVDLTGLEAALPGITARLRFIDAPLLEISSSEIRQRIAAGRPFRYYLPGPVYRYIETNRLYREGDSPRE